MCGIIAALAQRNVVPILLEGLLQLEYRGYDSAGLAVIDSNNRLLLHKTKGKVKALHALVNNSNTQTTGLVGIAHTRWATHGKPSESNAHPHIINNKIGIVHNGIIENHEYLKSSIIEKMPEIIFKSATDSEVIAARIYYYKQQGLNFLSAVIQTCKELSGAYAICVIDIDDPGRIIAAKFGSPLVVGMGVGEYFVASDSVALQHLTQNIMYLKDGDVVQLSSSEILIYDLNGKKIKREYQQSSVAREIVNKGNYRHFMQKEIFEQPQAIANTIEGRILNGRLVDNFLSIKAKNIFAATKHIQIIACGTSYYAGLVAKHLLEEFAGIHCCVDIASEFRYRNKVILDNTLLIAISQSGETADTVAALKNVLEVNDVNKYCGFVGICNVAESTLVRYCDVVLLTRAGPEIGVASTKGFTSQLAVIFILLGILIEKNGNKPLLSSKEIFLGLSAFSRVLDKILKLSDQVKIIARKFEHKKSALFLGRGLLFPLALEGALKLKELSYIHAEAFAAGELKHGPLALVDDEMPVIVLMPNNQLVEKLKSNIQEVLSRGGDLIIFADEAIKWRSKRNLHIIEVPSVPHWLAPLAYAIPVQLLAYHVAVLKGTDVDQPRHLAKSVTVE